MSNPDPVITPPPPNLVIYEGSLSYCEKCGSSVKRNWYFRVIGCWQPECSNYWKRQKSEKPKAKPGYWTPIHPHN